MAGTTYPSNTMAAPHNNTLHSRLTIIQHNVIAWTYRRRQELCNHYRRHDPDIILINSHSLKHPQTLKIFNYTTYTSNKTNEGSDGVAIAVKQHIKHKILDTFTSELMAIEIDTPHGPIIIATTYIPPRRPYIDQPDIYQLLRHRKPTYIMGDFNAHHRLFGYTDTNAVGRGLASLISDGRLTHLGPHAPTFIRDNSSTTPDIVLANTQANLNHHITTDDVTSSDHLPVILTLSTNPIMVPTPPREILKHANWEGFKQALEHTHTPDLEGQPTHTIDHHLNQWYADIQTAREANIPKTTFKTLVHYKETHRLKTLKIQYRHLRDLAETQGWNTELRSRYREIQRQLTNETKYMSNQHWETLTRELCNNIKDPKVFWLKYRRLLGSNRQTITYIYNTNRQKIDTAEGMEAVHREFWQQNFQISPAENTTFDPDTETEVTQTLQQLQHLILPSQTISLNTLSPDDPLSRPITPEDMRHAHTRTNNTTPGASNINKLIMQHLPPIMLARLRHIFNAALATGYFPSRFKRATLVLIPKPGKPPHEVTSFRPISLLEVPGKMLERLITHRLKTHLENNNTHNTRQHGFRPHRGTGSAIALAYEEIALSLANKHQTNIILRDVTKAFDKVWHDGLKYKITQLHLPPHLTRLLCNFLDDRSANIRLGSYLGPSIHLRSGVPQGSVLSPTLYTLYTASLPPPAPYSNYTAYADDITQIISHPSKSKNIMKAATQTAINTINTYENKWKIQTNTNKFTIIPLARYNPPPITINNRDIPYANKGNMLGLHFSKHGISKHAQHRISQACTALNKIRRFSYCSTQTKLKLYKTTVRPILEYTPIPLIAISKTQKHRMQSIQNKALYWINNTTTQDRIYHGITAQSLHRTYNIEPLNIRIHTLAKRTWDRIQHIDNTNYDDIIQKHIHTHTNHAWFPRTLPHINGDPPEPLYVL